MPEMNKRAGELVAFSAKALKKAKLIKDIDILENINNELNTGKAPVHIAQLEEFFFEHLIDCIRILIFFENYMKAELIIKNFCVHEINKDIPGFKDSGKSHPTAANSHCQTYPQPPKQPPAPGVSWRS